MTIARSPAHMELVDRNQQLLLTASYFAGLAVLTVPILLFAPFQDGRGTFVIAALALAGLSYWMLFHAYHVSRVEILADEQRILLSKKPLGGDFGPSELIRFDQIERIEHAVQLTSGRGRGQRSSTISLVRRDDPLPIRLYGRPCQPALGYRGDTGPLAAEAQEVAELVGTTFVELTGVHPLRT